MLLNNIKKDLQKLANPHKAKTLAGFFKTGKGEYGEGDIFLGITVPEQRKIANKYSELSLEDMKELLHSKIHEYRLVALLILVEQFKKTVNTRQKEIFNFYLKNTNYINNWDLIDLSAPTIMGQYILENSEAKPILYKLAKSDSLWERRISILATFAFIKAKKYKDSLKIAKKLLKDKHDLIHKACGWMLREVGKRDKKLLMDFLDQNCGQMPRVMLRYAIEKLSPELRTHYLRP